MRMFYLLHTCKSEIFVEAFLRKFKILQVPIPQNSQIHSNNSSAVADELFECAWLFCGVSAWRFNYFFKKVSS